MSNELFLDFNGEEYWVYYLDHNKKQIIAKNYDCFLFALDGLNKYRRIFGTNIVGIYPLNMSLRNIIEHKLIECSFDVIFRSDIYHYRMFALNSDQRNRERPISYYCDLHTDKHNYKIVSLADYIKG